jgi:UDP-2,4-diacetamido-2,4,6-trideoxy-beta-L-altropyranose hydrolase
VRAGDTPLVVIRVAGSGRLGFGHVRRCWTLAEELAATCSVRFVATSGEVAAFLAKRGFAAATEPDPRGISAMLALLTSAPPASVVVVDDPDLSTGAIAALRAHGPVLVIDDPCTRVLPADLVVNGSAGAETLRYRGASDTRYFLGTPYMILRTEFALDPSRSPVPTTPRRILVLAGGGNATAVCGAVVDAVRDALPAVAIDVVVGPFAGPPLLPPTAGVTLHREPSDMRTLMLAADLAVTGAGQTAYELAATATPAIALRLADNQAVNLRGLVAAGVVIDGGVPDAQLRDRLVERVRWLAADPALRARMAEAGRHLVDGRGTGRVATEVIALATAGAMS